MSNILFANNARTILSSAINNSTTILPVSSTTGFPTISGGDYFYVTLDDGSNIEIVKVTAATSNTFTVVRAQDGTSAHSFAATTTRVENRLNAGVISEFVPKTGATMTGTLTLNGNAVGNYDAVPLQQLVNSPGFLGTPTAPTAAPGTNTTQLATTAFVTNAVSTLASSNLVYKFVSGEYAVPNSTSVVTIAHGKGSVPSIVEVRLRCIDAEHSFSAGQEVIWNVYDNGAADRISTYYVDNTNIYVAYQANSPGTYPALRETGGTIFSVDPSKWKIVVYAIWL